MNTNTIQTGDAILIRAGHGVLGRATKYFTHGEYTHAGLAFWWGGELWVAELNGGRNHLTLLSQWNDYDVYARPPEVSVQAIETEILRWLGSAETYGYSAFVVIGLLEWLRIQQFVHWRKIVVCSGAVIARWEACGWPEHSRMMSPTALSKLLTLKLQVRPGMPLQVSHS